MDRRARLSDVGHPHSRARTVVAVVLCVAAYLGLFVLLGVVTGRGALAALPIGLAGVSAPH